MKVLKYRQKPQTVALESPIGGVFHVRIPTIRESQSIIEIVTRQELVRDEDGAILYNQKSGAPAMRVRFDQAELVEAACSLVDRVEGIKDEDTGEMLASSPELIAGLLGLSYSFEVETPPKKEGEKPGVKTARKFLAEWLWEEASKLASAQAEVEEKNSSSTRSGTSELAAE